MARGHWFGFESRRINTEAFVLKTVESERPGNVRVLQQQTKKYPQACEEVSDVTDTWF